MKFILKPPLIFFHDDRPGQHATLFASNGQKFPFRSDMCSFKDAHADYTWAFEGQLVEGDRIVFATSDREVVGRVREGKIELDAPSVGSVPNPGVVRNEADKPIADAKAQRTMTLGEVFQPPYSRSHPRPIAMPRPKRWV
jgi:hypothetical protein